MMRVIVVVIVTAIAGPLGACKDRNHADDRARDTSAEQGGVSDPGDPGSGRPGEPPPSRSAYRGGDDTAAGRMLATFDRDDARAPGLSGDPACSDYASNMRTLLVDMDQRLRRLRDLGHTGVPMNDLLAFSSWLDSRAGMLEQIGRARALADTELGRAHREFTAAVADLAISLGEAYSDPAHEPDPEHAVRLGNAVDNFTASIRALEARCSGS